MQFQVGLVEGAGGLVGGVLERAAAGALRYYQCFVVASQFCYRHMFVILVA